MRLQSTQHHSTTQRQHTLQTSPRPPHASLRDALWWLCSAQVLFAGIRYKSREQANLRFMIAKARMISFLEDVSENLLVVRGARNCRRQRLGKRERIRRVIHRYVLYLNVNHRQKTHWAHKSQGESITTHRESLPTIDLHLAVLFSSVSLKTVIIVVQQLPWAISNSRYLDRETQGKVDDFKTPKGHNTTKKEVGKC